MHPIMYGVMTDVDDPRLDGKSSGLSSLPASRSDEPAREAGRVSRHHADETTPRRIRIAPDARKMSSTRGSGASRASGGSRAIAFEDRAKEYSVGTVNVSSSPTHGVAKSTRLHLRLVYRERDAVFRFVGCIGRGHPARRACDARFDA